MKTKTKKVAKKTETKFVEIKIRKNFCLIGLRFSGGKLHKRNRIWSVMKNDTGPISYNDDEVEAWKRIEKVLNANEKYIKGEAESTKALIE